MKHCCLPILGLDLITLSELHGQRLPTTWDDTHPNIRMVYPEGHFRCKNTKTMPFRLDRLSSVRNRQHVASSDRLCRTCVLRETTEGSRGRCRNTPIASFIAIGSQPTAGHSHGSELRARSSGCSRSSGVSQGIAGTRRRARTNRS